MVEFFAFLKKKITFAKTSKSLNGLGILFFLGFTTTISFAQVGIGTTTPSSAAVLHLSTTNFATTTRGGFLMPVVTGAQQTLIPVTAIDDGLMVFVSDASTSRWCWEIYDAPVGAWRCIDPIFTTTTCDTPTSGPALSIIQQDFDSNTDWLYMSNIAYFQDIPNQAYYDISNGPGFPLLTLTNNFFGARDYEEITNPTPEEALLTFYQVNVSAITTATFTFDFDSIGFEEVGTHYFGYQVFYDGIGQGYVSICNGCNNDLSGTVSVAIPDTVTDFHVVVIVSNQRDVDYVGFDNFIIQ